nr:reverse transcriptase domain-containing protein [Tanacetum cinerariifolium]
MKSQQSTNAFVKETFMHLKTQLETVAKNHQASIQNLETKFDRLADKKSGRPSRSLPSSTQPNPRGSNSKAYQPPQSRNEHRNAIFTRSGKSYDPPDNPNDQNFINFNSDDEDNKPTPQPKTQLPKPVKETPVPLIWDDHFFTLLMQLFELNKKQLNLGAGTELMIFNIDSAMKHSYSNDVIGFSIDVIDEILEEDIYGLLDEGSKILLSSKEPFSKKKYFLNLMNSWQ